MCAYQGVRNVNFSENFVYVLSQFVVFKPLSYSFKEIVGFKNRKNRPHLQGLQFRLSSNHVT